jgi:protein gp37
MGESNIEWTDVTDNIIRVVGGGWWCRKISPGCTNCYAELLNQNAFFNGNKLLYKGKPPKLFLVEKLIAGWCRQRKPKKHFVSSMTDVFGDWVPREWIFKFLDGMWFSPEQTFQVLTKRADVMEREVKAWLESRGLRKVAQHIWLGVSVENQKCADERIEHLLAIPAMTRFLSVEPMLDSIDFKFRRRSHGFPMHIGTEGQAVGMPQGIHWVIIGGESGDKARPCNVGWIRQGVRQCFMAGVPVFVKQLGENIVSRNDAGFEGESDSEWPMDTHYKELDPAVYQGAPVRVLLKDKKGGDMAEWPVDLRVREFPAFAGG